MRRMRRGTTWLGVGLVALLAVPAVALARADLDVGEMAQSVAFVVERAAERISSTVVALFGAGDPVRTASAVEAVSEDGSFQWTGVVERGDAVEILTVNGDVRARPASGDRVEVVARKEGRRGDPSDVRIEVVEHAGGVTLCAVYPTPAGETPNACAPGDGARLKVRQNDVQVSFEVRVPRGVTLDVETVNGDVEALDLDGDARVESVNGDVEVLTSGFAEARTVNGSVRASVGAPAFADGVEFSTVNGSIELDLPDDIDADLHASWVNGGLDTDLPFHVQGVVSKRSARGTLGDGGPTLRLETVNGSIRIR